MTRFQKNRILILGGSVRNKADQELVVNRIEKIGPEPMLYSYIENVAREGLISNTEGAALAAAYGMKGWADEIRYERLNRFFDLRSRRRDTDRLLEAIADSRGVLVATPVYFGDRSSYLQDLFAIIRREKGVVEGKMFGMVSVGAKRNGGQETTNIYALNEAAELGFLVVGNGPPTSQYGGTMVGGNMGTMENDYFGIMTSIGTGKNVARGGKFLAGMGRSGKTKKKLKIAIWLLQDVGSRLRRVSETIAAVRTGGGIEYSVVDLTKCSFSKCLACNACPHHRDEPSLHYKCRIKNDDMRTILDQLLGVDAVLLGVLDPPTPQGLKTVYQLFTERTRFIRRDDFLLSFRLFAGLVANEKGRSSVYPLKLLTSYIRHNTIFHRHLEYGSDVVDPQIYMMEELDRFEGYVRRIASAVSVLDVGEQKYLGIGY